MGEVCTHGSRVEILVRLDFELIHLAEKNQGIQGRLLGVHTHMIHRG